jgi:RNA polymerase sigma-70 factor, ECF subfamily
LIWLQAMTSERELELVHWAQRGAPGAFDQLLAPYRQRLLRLIVQVVHNPEDAEDVLQETILRAYRAIRNFRGDSAFYTWLFRIALNTAKAFVTSRLHRNDLQTDSVDASEAIELPERESDYVTPLDILEAKELAEEVGCAIAHLPKEHSAAITMYEIDGLTYQQIADVMVCPIGTVRSRISNARLVIGSCFEPMSYH